MHASPRMLSQEHHEGLASRVAAFCLQGDGDFVSIVRGVAGTPPREPSSPQLLPGVFNGALDGSPDAQCIERAATVLTAAAVIAVSDKSPQFLDNLASWLSADTESLGAPQRQVASLFVQKFFHNYNSVLPSSWIELESCGALSPRFCRFLLLALAEEATVDLDQVPLINSHVSFAWTGTGLIIELLSHILYFARPIGK